MSLEGLNSLIQLEGARLESARQTSQNFQQVGSAVQQLGMQTASAKQQLWYSKLDATYTKECAEADVRKIEAQLARARKAEGLAKGIALGVAAISGVGNLWNAAQDMLGSQKLGDIPNYMKVKPIDPNNSQIFYGKRKESTNEDGNKTGQMQQTITAVGKVDNDTETVQQIDKFSGGGMVSPKSATLSKYDIDRVLGNDPEYLKIRGSGINFSELLAKNEDLAAKVFKDKAHGMGREEAEGFMKVLDHNFPQTKATQLEYSETPAQTPDAKDQTAKVAEITGFKPLNKDTDQDKISKINEIVKANPKAPKDFDASKEITRETLEKLKEDDPNITARISAIVNPPTQSNTTSNIAPTSSNTDKPINIEMPKNASFAVINKQDGSQEVTMYDKDRNRAVTQTFSKADLATMATNMGANKDAKFEDLFNNKKSEAINQFVKFANDHADFDPANGKVRNSNIKVVDGVQDAASAFGNKIEQSTVVPAAIDSLKAQGLLDKNYDSNILTKGIATGEKYLKPLVNALVSTAQDTAPYIQAYLKAKDKADDLENELMSAKTKLAAAVKKLNTIEMQIDQFNGRGA